jgi:hypothetical protein
MPKAKEKSIIIDSDDSDDTIALKEALKKKIKAKRKQLKQERGEPGRSRPKPAEPGRTRPNPPVRPGSSHVGQRVGLWTKDQVLQAWEDHQAGMSITAAGKKNGVPRSSLTDKFRKAKELRDKGQPFLQVFGHCSGGKEEGRVFNFREEKMLADHLSVFAEGGCGLTCKEFREVAHHWAVENSFGKVDPDKNEMSYHWYYAFLERHPELQVLKPMELSLHRAAAPSQFVVNQFFDKLEYLVNKYNLNGSNIWNIDETGIMDQPHAQKVIIPVHTPKFQLVAGERGQLTTVLAFANAAGDVCDPTVIMKGENLQHTWREYKPDGWLLFNSHNGWINKQIFLKTARKFLKHLEARGELGKPQVILLDGHASHSYNFAFANLMAAHNIFVVQFPAHCTHFLQPYDSVLLALLKKNWQDELRVYNRMNAGTKLSKVRFFIPFRKCWRKTMQVHYVQASFRKTGIWPLDRDRVNQGWFKAREALKRTGAILPEQNESGQYKLMKVSFKLLSCLGFDL